MSNIIRYSHGSSKTDNQPDQIVCEDFDAFAGQFLSLCSNKKGEAYVCASMSKGAHPNQAKYQHAAHYRLSKLCDDRRFIAFDVDGLKEGGKPDHVHALLKYVQKRYRGFDYRTPSDAPDNPRFRIILELDRCVSRYEGNQLGAALQASFEDAIGHDLIEFDQSVYRGEQPIYTPLKDALSSNFGHDLPPVCVDDFLDRYEAPSTSVDGFDAKDTPPSLNLNKLNEIKDLVPFLHPPKPSESFDRDKWISIGYAIYNETCGDNEGLSIYDEVSQSCSKYKGFEDVEYTWSSFHIGGDNPAKIGTLKEIARENGWRGSATEEDMASLKSEGLPPEVPKKQAFEFITGQEVMKNFKHPKWVIRDILQENCLALINGAPGVGKSFIAFDMACSVATGVKWADKQTQTGGVFYIAGEGHNGIAPRLQAWQKDRDIEISDNLFVSKFERNADLSNNSDVEGVLQALRGLYQANGKKPFLIIIDTLARNFRGDENSSKDMGAFVSNVDRIKDEWGAAVVIVHHPGHSESGRARGSSCLKGAVDHEYLVKRNGDEIIMQCTKMKEARAMTPMKFILVDVPLSYRDDKGREIIGAVIDYVGPKTPSAAKLKDSSLRGLNALKAAAEAPVENPEITTKEGKIFCPKHAAKRVLKTSDITTSDKVGTKNKTTDRVIEDLESLGYLVLQGDE